jgi:hypothetical protein
MKKKQTHKRLWLLVSDEDREALRQHAKTLGETSGIPAKVSLNYAGAVVLHQAIKDLRAN